MTTAAIALATALLTVINPGDLVTFTRPGMLDAVCVRVTALDLLPGDVPAAWIIYTGGAPVHALHAPLADLRPGCKRP